MRYGDARLQLVDDRPRVVVGALSSAAASPAWVKLERAGIVLGVAASLVTLHHYLAKR